MTNHFTLAQLSDTHICVPGGRLFNGVDSATQLQKALDWLLSEQIRLDAVLISGDLTQDGRVEEYRHLRQLLSPIAHKLPVY
jgi:3',5'-cyclic-AMP phosphodiesterase